jgi:hypothetical protein
MIATYLMFGAEELKTQHPQKKSLFSQIEMCYGSMSIAMERFLQSPMSAATHNLSTINL